MTSKRRAHKTTRFFSKSQNMELLLICYSISAHPNVNFTVVINPGNGPGPDSLPDANYTREIPKLAAHNNVRLLGYVHTTYATRNISLVRKDIETYAAWPTVSSNPGLAVRGIFFDETPQQYSAHSLAYLQNLTELTKGLNGLGSDPFVSYLFPFFSIPQASIHRFLYSLPLTSSHTPSSIRALLLRQTILLSLSLSSQDTLSTIFQELTPFGISKRTCQTNEHTIGHAQPRRRARLALPVHGRLNSRVRRDLRHLPGATWREAAHGYTGQQPDPALRCYPLRPE